MMLELDADGFSFGSLLGGGTLGSELSRHMSQVNSMLEQQLREAGEADAESQRK
jgi:hypothetical protein